MKKIDSPAPTFIIDINSREICDVNEKVVAYCNSDSNPIGENLSDVVYLDHNTEHDVTPAFFNDCWFLAEQQTIFWEGSPHLEIQLQRRKDVPDIKTMRSLKKMIGFLLHRIRSPLTGIQGYTELIADNLTQDSKYIGQIEKGVNQLFNLLDELEDLEEISLNPLDLNNYSTDPEKIIREIISGYTPEQQENITFTASDNSQNVRCTPSDLRAILSILIGNAVEHAPIDQHQVSISQPTPYTIKIAHNGNTIPESIVQELFYPFVTTKARKLGIGLTMAILYAKRCKGSIFLTNNNPFGEVSFTFFLPPLSFTSPQL